MTLTQRLTRAGLAFIVFGTAVALFPTNGNASAATDGCTIVTQSYTVGAAPQDKNITYTALNGSVSLTEFLGAATTTAGALTSKDAAGFTTTILGSTVTTTTTAATGTKDTVTVSFPGGRVVTYTVVA